MDEARPGDVRPEKGDLVVVVVVLVVATLDCVDRGSLALERRVVGTRRQAATVRVRGPGTASVNSGKALRRAELS